MADGIWKDVFGYSKQLLLNEFFDPSTPSMRKRDGGKNGGKKKKRLIIIVATTSMPAVDRPNTDCWNAARSCQEKKIFTYNRSIEFLQVK